MSRQSSQQKFYCIKDPGLKTILNFFNKLQPTGSTADNLVRNWDADGHSWYLKMCKQLKKPQNC